MRPSLDVVVCVLGLLAAGGCRSTPADSLPALTIPHFAADDERVDTAGFVAATRRVHVDVDGVRYTLMAFAVAETLTLGAMVEGDFAGDVCWRVGERTLSFPFDTGERAGEVPVAGGGAAAGEQLVGQGAVFRGTTWLNIDVPVAEWLPGEATALALTFVSPDGALVTIPAGAGAFAAELVRA